MPHLNLATPPYDDGVMRILSHPWGIEFLRTNEKSPYFLMTPFKTPQVFLKEAPTTRDDGNVHSWRDLTTIASQYYDSRFSSHTTLQQTWNPYGMEVIWKKSKIFFVKSLKGLTHLKPSINYWIYSSQAFERNTR